MPPRPAHTFPCRCRRGLGYIGGFCNGCNGIIQAGANCEHDLEPEQAFYAIWEPEELAGPWIANWHRFRNQHPGLVGAGVKKGITSESKARAYLRDNRKPGANAQIRIFG